jgi:hypothetical protein
MVVLLSVKIPQFFFGPPPRTPDHRSIAQAHRRIRGSLASHLVGDQHLREAAGLSAQEGGYSVRDVEDGAGEDIRCPVSSHSTVSKVLEQPLGGS